MKHITRFVSACLLLALVWLATATPVLAAGPSTRPGIPLYTGEVPADEPVRVTGVKLSRKYLTIRKGATYALSAQVQPAEAENQNLIFESTRPSVVTVDDEGMLTGVKEGKAVVRVFSEDGRKKATCEVTVGQPTTRIALNEKRVELTANRSVQLKATVLPKNASNRRVEWISSNPKVAKVNRGGKVTALKPGKATITAKAQDTGRRATCIIRVGTSVQSVALSSEALSLSLNQTWRLKATIAPANAANKTVTWKSSNPRVVSVDEKGNLRGLRVGKGTITATTKDGKKTARCVVYVHGRIFSGRNRVTSGYRTASRPDHNGIDIVGMDSNRINCTVSGRIRWARQVAPGAPGWGSTWEWGYFVWVESDDGTHHIFAHMAGQPFVQEGQRVTPGTPLGIMGNTGYSFGTHTHYEVRLGDRKTTVDPSPYAGVPNAVGIYG